MATKIEGWIGNTAEQWLKDNYSGAILFRKTEAVGELSATLVIHDGPPERVYTESELEAERKSNRELLQTLADALFKAEQYMTSTGDRIGPGCLCHCPVIDGHTGSCPIPPAMRLAASKGITPTHD